jgi:hypothetical protein
MVRAAAVGNDLVAVIHALWAGFRFIQEALPTILPPSAQYCQASVFPAQAKLRKER